MLRLLSRQESTFSRKNLPTLNFLEKMSSESESRRFLAKYPFDDIVKDLPKWPRISYSRDFLLSIAKLDTCKILPRGGDLSILHEFEDAFNHFSPSSRDSDSRFDKSITQCLRQNSEYKGILGKGVFAEVSGMPALKLENNDCHLLHRSDEPYQPPHRFKAVCPSKGQTFNLHYSETFGSSECLSLEIPEWNGKRRASFELASNRQQNLVQEKHNRNLEAREGHVNANIIKLLKEDKKLTNKCSESKESLVSPELRNIYTLQSALNAINKQVDASDKSNLAQGVLTFEDLGQSIFLGINEDCSTKHHSVQDLNIQSTENRQQNSTNHIEVSGHLQACTELNVRSPDEYFLFEYDKNSSLPVTFGQGNDENSKKNLSREVMYGNGCTKELELTNASVCIQGSPGRTGDGINHESISPSDVEQCSSIGMMDNISGNDSPTKQGSESNYFRGFDEKSDPFIELGLPDEDSLITVDEPFYVPDEDNLITVEEAFYIPDEENWIRVYDSMFSPERNSNENDLFTSSSLADMAEKLVESIISDEDSNPYHLGGATLLNNYCDETVLPASYHTLHPQQSSQFHHDQLNPGRNFFHPLDNQQVHLSSQRKTSNTKTYPSQPCHHIQSDKFSHPLHLSHNELKRFDHDVNHPFLQQMPILNEFSIPQLNSLQRGEIPCLPTCQMACYTQELNSMQDGTLNYQRPNYGSFVPPNPDPCAGGNSNIAVDILFDIKQRALHVQPYSGGNFQGTLGERVETQYWYH
ncbi:Chorismate synthase [Quillaja saponaria]|uniref:Chorismate synthase n=1 Tax=Quillaja saponaria TaxID=32244 RepID=A0AAD7M4S6_QUISA|nr:Chorismate synthase [Quillaja saponaria]